MKHYLIIGGKLESNNIHHKSLLTTLQGNNINEIVLIITGMFHLICSQTSNYELEGNNKIMRILNKINDETINYIEIKEVTI